jgi:hypothetical protein
MLYKGTALHKYMLSSPIETMRAKPSKLHGS